MNQFGKSAMRKWRSRRGVASALIIMILVLLIFFGILSLVTAAADLRLSSKRADWNQEYYLADAKAVSVVAGLDQYLNSMKALVLEPDVIEESITAYLGDAPNIQDYQIIQQGQSVQLSALIAEKADASQGIQIVLQVKAGKREKNTSRITVQSWAQWQPPFQYDGQNGGVWKG